MCSLSRRPAEPELITPALVVVLMYAVLLSAIDRGVIEREGLGCMSTMSTELGGGDEAC
jgi:hypothetical protein